MGFLGSLFKKKEKPIEEKNAQKIEISMDQLTQWIEQTNSANISSVRLGLASLWDEVKKHTAALQSAIKSLESARFEPEDRTYAVINMTKDIFVKKAASLAKLPKSIGKDYSAINCAYLEVVGIVDSIKDANAKQAYIISNYFKKEADEIVRSIKQIDRNLMDFQKKLTSDGVVLRLVEEANRAANEYSIMQKKLSETNKARLEMSMELNKYTAGLEAHVAELEKIRNDKRWDEISRLDAMMGKTEAEMRGIVASVNEDISSIKRPIRKLLHGNDQLAKGQIKALTDDAIIENIESVYLAVKSLDPLLHGKEIGLKETELEKIKYVRSKAESGELKRVKERYSDLVKEKESVGGALRQLSAIEDEKKLHEMAIEAIKSDMAKLRSEMVMMDLEIKRVNESKEKLKADIGVQILATLDKNIVVS